MQAKPRALLSAVTSVLASLKYRLRQGGFNLSMQREGGSGGTFNWLPAERAVGGGSFFMESGGSVPSL